MVEFDVFELSRVSDSFRVHSGSSGVNFVDTDFVDVLVGGLWVKK